MSAVEFRRTRFKELGYAQILPNLWRIVDTEDGETIGPHYQTRTELLADLGNYAAQYGCQEAAQ